MKKAIVLLSGGLDSATVLAIAQSRGFACSTLSFSYGQRHCIELQAAKRIAQAAAVTDHRVVNLDLRAFGGSSLTSESLQVPKDRVSIQRENEESVDVSNTYVPARNTIFLSFALAFAEVTKSENIFFGANVLDYSSYPDCRPEYIRAYEEVANLGTVTGLVGARFKIHAPLISLTKAEIIKIGYNLGVDYELTHSCYDPDGELACGHCDSCVFRKRGFIEAGIFDPTHYVASSC